MAAPEGGSPGGSGASVVIRIIGALEGGEHPRVDYVSYENKYITVYVGTLMPSFELGCDAVSFLFFAPLILLLFSPQFV